MPNPTVHFFFEAEARSLSAIKLQAILMTMTASSETPSSSTTGVEGHGKTQQDNLPRSIALPKDYSPQSFDVLCGRGRDYYQHVGNQRFRLIVSLSLQRYARAMTKHDKGLIIISIVDTIRQASPHGGFIRFDRKSGNWYEIGDDAARKFHCELSPIHFIATGKVSSRLTMPRQTSCRRKGWSSYS